MTVAETLQEAARRLAAVTDSPRLEAEVLLAEVRGQTRAKLLAELKDEVDEEARRRLEALVNRRLEGEPLAYILGRREFMSLAFRVSPEVLIPRPETETLVETALAILAEEKWPRPLVVDVGTGCGNIALSIAFYHPRARVIAVDLSRQALAVARTNARSLGLEGRVTFRRGDLLRPILGRGKAEMVVANLPYIPSEEVAHLPPEVRQEPVIALDGGPDGLVLYRRLLRQVPLVLRPGGYLVAEIHPPQEPSLKLLFVQAGMGKLTVSRDIAGRPRVVAGKFFGRPSRRKAVAVV